MKFDELHALVPYAKGGKEKILSMEPYPNIKLLLPGRHALDTTPVGGDFCVCVTDPIYPRADHQFTHTDIFKQAEKFREQGLTASEDLDVLKMYCDIIKGEDPDKYTGLTWEHLGEMDGIIKIDTFFYAVQCLAVAEHRRYAKYENKFGGRYLPFRFTAGIIQGLWTAADAANMQKKGRPGVEMLEKLYGTPFLTQGLMK